MVDFDNIDTLNDSDEIEEWLEAIDDVLLYKDKAYAKRLIAKLVSHYQQRVGAEVFGLVTSSCNTVSVDEQAPLPDDGVLSHRAHQYILWNAMAMVVRAGHRASELGGHIATFASISTLYRVGFDYIFSADSEDTLGDIVYFQGHASPGVYARSFLEGRFSRDTLDRFRQECAEADGLSSYPHPHLMPHYWQFPTVSMGLGPLQAIYQARWQHYLSHRLSMDLAHRTVWAFCGDGEMDEPESRGALQIASKERLGNLIFVVNCNLQRLDGPVRGNSSIISELEACFHGAGWQVIKVMHNSAWDEVFALDPTHQLVEALGRCVDGQMQTLCAQGPKALLDYIAHGNAYLTQLVSSLDHDLIERLGPGGHDAIKVYNAYKKALSIQDTPVAILVHTIKGNGLGQGIASANTTHQQKKLSDDALRAYAKHLAIPLSDDAICQAEYYHPGDDDAAIQYLHQQRKALNGYMPTRLVSEASLAVPELSVLESVLNASTRPMSTTMAFVRVLSLWLREGDFGPRLVPIVPDESRTFGMEGLFRQIGIYTSQGQQYEPVDKKQVMYYKESAEGQLLQEGINEAGASASWLAAATSYSTNHYPMLPLYIFYSMFGFQRVGDMLWAAGDMHARGFLFGATAGRTTLAGEGLQHNDGQSHIMASLIPNCVSYDPCYAYELAVIMQYASKRMYVQGDDVFYYITLMNENYAHPSMPSGVEKGIINGMYPLKPSSDMQEHQLHLLGSGCILREVESAALWLDAQGINACVWSVTSFTELSREAEVNNTTSAYVTACLGDAKPVVAASDYVKQYAEQIRAYVPGDYYTLGTDGFGRSDTRKSLRAYFQVNADAIIRQSLSALLRASDISKKRYTSLVAILDKENGISEE